MLHICGSRYLFKCRSKVRYKYSWISPTALGRPLLDISPLQERVPEYQPFQFYSPEFQLGAMATQISGQQMVLNPEKAGLMSFPGITAESTRTASELLQKNDNDYHGFFSHLGIYSHESGFAA